MKKPKLLIKKHTLKGSHWFSLYKCPYCDNNIIVRKLQIEEKKVKSCGCVKNKLISQSLTTHGLRHTNLYSRWQDINKRCRKGSSQNNKYYYGRGIKVCKKWRESFMAFYNWALANGYKKELEIDRINNSRGYSPENCRWVTHKENCNNRRQKLLI